MLLPRNTFEKLNTRPLLHSALSRSEGQRRKGGLQHRTRGVGMEYIHSQHGHRQTSLVVAFMQAPCSHSDVLMSPSQQTFCFHYWTITLDNFFWTEAPPAPRPAPACCLSQPSRDLSHSPFLMPSARHCLSGSGWAEASSKWCRKQGVAAAPPHTNRNKQSFCQRSSVQLHALHTLGQLCIKANASL